MIQDNGMNDGKSLGAQWRYLIVEPTLELPTSNFVLYKITSSLIKVDDS